MEMGSSRFGEDAALDPHPGRAVGASPAAVPVPWDKARAPSPGHLPLSGRGAQEGTAAAWLQQWAQVLGQMGIWNGPNQSKQSGN